MSKHQEFLSEDSDNSEDETPIFKAKKGLVIDSTDEEDSDLSRDKSEYTIEKNLADNSQNSLLITSTPGDEKSERPGKSYFAASLLGKYSPSDIIPESDEEVPDREEVEENNTHYRKRISFLTPQNKKYEIDDDTDTDNSDLDADVIDTSQILDDSFDAATTKVSAKKTENKISPKPSTGICVTISSDSDENDASYKNNDMKQIKDGKVQTKLDAIFKKLTPKDISKSTDASSKSKIECKRTEYHEQLNFIRIKEHEMMQAKRLLTNCNIASLPDKGELLKKRFEQIKTKFLEAQNRLRNMIVVEDQPEMTDSAKRSPLSNWNNLEAGLAVVQPKTFGKKGLENFQNQKALTMESLEQLHGSLKNCPKDDQMADEPKHLKVKLMEHQRRALAWMMYREQQKPPGGILADDMGLGKTLTMISLVLKTKENDDPHEETDDEDKVSKKHRKFNGGTLVVCPASLLNQWAHEIDSKLKRGIISYNVYHGPKREVKPKRLAEHDVVITTYSIVMNEMEREGAIFRVRWSRIILDEAHQIRNHKSQTSVACCTLAGKYRWALTGTPVHNKELDMYALLKFLRCSPFDDLTVWKRWVGDRSSGGGERLNTVISSLMLRRTKSELISQGKLNDMPSRKWDLIPVTLDESEMSLYQKILLFSQTLFAQFLHQKAEKNQDIINIRNSNGDPNSEYFKMRKKLLALNQMREVNQHEILVLLLRLRQICCHPSLITNMLQGDEDLGDEEPEEREEINLLDQLNKLNLNDESDVADGISTDKVGFKEATKGILNPSHPLFAKDRISSKVKFAMKLIPSILSTGDKIIIVSQWTSFLELVGWQLKEAGIKFTKLDGSVPTSKRTEIVNNFNDPNTKVKVLLLSLTAGGVGLNLVGANHLFLLDLHWNPQLENQAQDRIYRMGQKKNVNIYKFMATETIEERIKKLQEDKIEISESMLTGSKRANGNKLSLQDLKMLFNM